MKKMKKIFALVLATAMVMAMSTIGTFAAGTGSITITPPNDIDKTQTITYEIYKVFDADGNGKNISYKLVSGKTTAPAGFTVDAAGNVTYSGSGNDELTEDDITAIANYVRDSDLVATVTSTGGANAVASGLANGYYYITTTAGTVVTIDSTNPSASVEDKNIVPDVNKTISDASSLDADGKKALAQVGTDVEYTVEISVGKGQKNYVLKDTFGTGLAYKEASLKVTDMTEGTDYTLDVSGQNITVTFKDDTIKKLQEGTTITVKYKATVTSDALQRNPAKNTATISYGNNATYTSDPSEVEVYNAKFTVIKQDGDKKPLAGAGFVIARTAAAASAEAADSGDSDGESDPEENAEAETSAMEYYKLTNGVVTWVSSIDDATEYTSNASGEVTSFTGLADGTYTLIEKTVPSGYNKAADETFTIEKGNYTTTNLEQSSTVTNNSGSTLPSTGGIGTTIFYVVGAILVIGAGVVMITRRRMDAQ